mmetsp:Transcript_32468/g.74377  ORF Transcript_32468/g.74377 Transcript_32468/m.74377 type:complete len:2019 (-) Transcript_32468:454-6510(-)
MFLLGDKIASTIIAQSAKVPCVSWSGSGVTVAPDETGRVEVSEEVFDKACVKSAAEALEVANTVGYPIMIKASEGGGGKGVRKAMSSDQIETMYQQVCDEVKGSPVFLMRLCSKARHVEIQLMCDKHRNVSVLSGRDCSMQRRFQKIVEEGPPIAVPQQTMREMELAAGRLALMVDYTHAGTVEYLFLEETNEFYFLELNPRLQVEHPVTEGITGCNVPALQLMVAMGCDLNKLTADTMIHKYIVDFNSDASTVDPFAKTDGHVIAVRITAENAADGWKPTVGQIANIEFQSLPKVWGYFSVKTPNAEVHAFADSQFGHLFAHGRTRKEAGRLLTLALKRLRVVGEIHTNIAYVQELIGTDDFVDNKIDTQWLDALIAQKMQLKPPDPSDVAICGALLKAYISIKSTEARLIKDYIGRKTCPTQDALASLVETKVEFIWRNKRFTADVHRHSSDLYTVATNGCLAQAKLQARPDGSFVATFAGKAHTFRYEQEPGDVIRMTLEDKLVMLEKEKDPSVLSAPYAGKLTQYVVEDGAHLERGEPFAEVEVMKMLFLLNTSEAGVISFNKVAGSFVEAGEKLASLMLDDPSLVAKATPFDDAIEDFAPPTELDVHSGPMHLQMHNLCKRVHNMLDGFVDNEEEVIHRLSEILLLPDVMLDEWADLMSGVGSKLPQGARDLLAKLKPNASTEGFGAEVLQALESFETKLDEAAAATFKAQAEPLYSFAARFKTNLLDHATIVVKSFLEHFLAVEQHYPDDKSELLGAYKLATAHEEEPMLALQGLLSHYNIERKVTIVLSVLDFCSAIDSRVDTHIDSSVLAALKELARLESTKHIRVQRKAKQITANFQSNIVEENKTIVLPMLRALAGGLSEEQELALVENMVNELTLAQVKVLAMLGDLEKQLRKAVAKAAIYMWYSRFCVTNLSVRTYLRKGKEKLVVSWNYRSNGGHEREGVLFVFSTLEDLETNFDDLCALTICEKESSKPPDVSVPLAQRRSSSKTKLSSCSPDKTEIALHVLVLGEELSVARRQIGAYKPKSVSSLIRQSFRYAVLDEKSTASTYHKVLMSKPSKLRNSGVRHVSVLLLHSGERDNMNYISIFNFPCGEDGDFEENRILRHILPPQADWLELDRLSNFHVERCWFPDAPMTHVYSAAAKTQKLDTRLFVRTLVLRKPSLTEAEGIAALETFGKEDLVAAFNTLEEAIGDSRYPKSETNHLFFRLLAPMCVPLKKLEPAIIGMLAPFVGKLQVSEVELVFPLCEPSSPTAPPRTFRVICRLSPAFQFKIFEEVSFESSTFGAASVELRPVSAGSEQPIGLEPYQLLTIVDQKRLKCQKLATTYAYDYPSTFDLAVTAAWEKAPSACGPPPKDKVIAVELVLNKEGSAVEPLASPRLSGTNNIGMLAWLMTLYTPECPRGRQIVVIANDITFMNGTFGPKEDIFFEKASQLARKMGVPRIYMSANSGARFGLSDAVKKCFRVQWNDPYDLSKGIKYLWLTDKDVESLGSAVLTEMVSVSRSPSGGADDDDDGDESMDEEVLTHNKITSIVGVEEGLGVESLQGAGKIAAETSIANREIFTLGYSTARNIGIGSYVLRLGQRVIQHVDAPIILTGYQALNKLLGTNVYESNDQLGGPEVMGGNGVSHLIVTSDLEGCVRIVEWLSFVPPTVQAPPPCLPIVDPVDRKVEVYPLPGTPYDPRMLLCGDGVKSGLLDKGSFVETLPDWAKTVVTGRGRLGGMPVGVIITENRLVEKSVLADPANLESKPQKAMQAGQVWFPDSAYKTAQAIQDFNTGEGLPLILLANWRGFSGGRKDMFEEVLKFGSFIVDQLTQFRQPIMVYIPPHSEIRGGAWVVIDSTINPKCMEMYAAENSRGGVLEPAGIAEIKFRKPEILKAMHRMDKQLKWMSMNEANNVVRPEDVSARESELLPYYQPLGEIFSDLHDRPERMLAKGVIRKIVQWKDSRAFFYWRLKRRIHEMAMVKSLTSANVGLSEADALAQIQMQLSASTLENDQQALEAMMSTMVID